MPLQRWIYKFTIISLVYLFSLSITYANGIKVLDADTIEYSGKKIRLKGIDAPELDQLCMNFDERLYPCGKIAADELEELIKSFSFSEFNCKDHNLDRYGRTLSTCWIGATNINSWLVKQGWAIAYRYYSKDYIREEQNAKKNSKGIWAGTFIEPWNWRRGTRFNSKTDNWIEQCSIKGNISAKGEKIYHVPSGRHYIQTKINSKKGEKWFCSELEALNNGWRKSKR